MRKTQNRMENKRKHLRVKCSDGMRLGGHEGALKQRMSRKIKGSSSGRLLGRWMESRTNLSESECTPGGIEKQTLWHSLASQKGEYTRFNLISRPGLRPKKIPTERWDSKKSISYLLQRKILRGSNIRETRKREIDWANIFAYSWKWTNFLHFKSTLRSRNWPSSQSWYLWRATLHFVSSHIIRQMKLSWYGQMVKTCKELGGSWDMTGCRQLFSLFPSIGSRFARHMLMGDHNRFSKRFIENIRCGRGEGGE